MSADLLPCKHCGKEPFFTIRLNCAEVICSDIYHCPCPLASCGWDSEGQGGYVFARERWNKMNSPATSPTRSER